MIVKKFRLFESVSTQSIIKRKKEIEDKWDLIISERNDKLIDIFVKPTDDEPYPAACYDTTSKKFTLFYDRLNGIILKRYITIPSETFFDELDSVVGRLYYDV
jgi:hypothetical protein